MGNIVNTKSVQVLDNALSRVKNELKQIYINRGPINIADSKVNSLLVVLKDKIDNSQRAIVAMPTILRNLKVKIAPLISNQTFVFYLVNITLGCVGFLLALILIDSFVQFGQCINLKIWSIIIKLVLLLTIILTFIMSSIIAAMSFDLLGEFECPIDSDSFGIRNVTHEVCQYPSDSLLSNFDLQSMSLNDSNISHRIDHLRNKGIEVFKVENQTYLLDSYHLELRQLNVSLKTIFNSLDFAINNSCVTEKDVVKINGFRNDFANFLDHARQLEAALVTYELKFGTLIDQSVEKLKDWHTNGVSDLRGEFDRLKATLSLADFQCHPICEEFRAIPSHLCSDVNVPLSEFSISLSVSILYSLAVIFILIFMCLRRAAKKEMQTTKAQQHLGAPAEDVFKPVVVALPLESPTSVQPSPARPTPTPDSPAPPSIHKSITDAVTYLVVSARTRLRRLKAHVDKMRKQEESDHRSDKFEKKGPIEMHLTGIDYIPEQQPEPDVVLDRVYYDPKGNEQYDIGSDVDIIAVEDRGGPGSTTKKKEDGELELAEDPTQKTE